jgi:hypothetical protein
MRQGDWKMRLLNEGKASIVPDGFMATGGKAGVRVHTGYPSNAQQAIAAGNVQTTARYIGLEIARAMSRNVAASGFAPGLAATVAWLRTQVGKPYGWGAVGPNAYDCSGLVSAAVNKAYGRNPYSRLGATGSMPWASMALGNGPFMVGWFKGNPGHTAMTINGINFESAGGVGVRMGKGARGAASSLFTSRRKIKGFAGGGPVGEGRLGDMPFDLLDPSGDTFLGKEFLRQMGIKVFDSGGTWAPHTLGANLSSHTETVASGNGDGMRLDGQTIRALGKEFARAVADQPVFLDSNRIDAGLAGAALGRRR